MAEIPKLRRLTAAAFFFPMHWTEPASAEDSHSELEKQLWGAANQMWANADLKPSEFSPVVLGLIFLRYADVRFAAVEADMGRDDRPDRPTSRRRRTIGPADYHAAGVIYLPKKARFAYLLSLPEGLNVGHEINEAMRAVEKENPDLADVLPKTYQILENRTLAELLKVMASIPMDKGGDTFGLIYEYFLGKFAMSEGQKGGEWSGATWTTIGSPEGWRGGANQFYTPTSIVRLIVEILEPYHGRIYDPACGSGGMFASYRRPCGIRFAGRRRASARGIVQSARFVENHHKNPISEISCHGQDKWAWGAHLRRAQRARRVRQRRKLPNQRVTETSRLARLNLAVHGLSGDIRQGNTYYEDLHDSVGRFDFVLANPPFNVSKIDKERLADDPRYAFGLPRTDNGNYLWIQHFHAALNATGRAGFVMANSAADARASEQEIREKLIKSGHVDVMISIGPKGDSTCRVLAGAIHIETLKS